jgi:hypothetical protein
MNSPATNTFRFTSARALCASLLLFAVGCSEDRTVPSYAPLNRSNAVEFACLDVLPEAGTQPVLAPLQSCRARVQSDLFRFRPFAFVTQSARGEVATIDLRSQQIIDSRRDIPGFTFIAAGESPSAIVVPKTRPDRTYVANFGSRDLYVFDTRSLLPNAQATEPLQIVPLVVTTADGARSAAPTRMVLTPAEDALLIAVPDLGRVLHVPLATCEGAVADCQAGSIDPASIASILLEASAERLVTPAQPLARPAYQQLCGFPREEPPPAQPIQIEAADLARPPHPRALAIDNNCIGAEPCPRLLVADDALPLIHVVALAAITAGDNADAVLAPIPVGAPTTELVVSPRVPVELGGLESTYYTYAIDATDGSVVVIEGTQVLNVNPPSHGRPDRLSIPSDGGRGAPAAISLAVLTPGFDTLADPSTQYLLRAPAEGLSADADLDLYCPAPDRPFQDAKQLRGVFLAVALSDGRIPLLDVHDMTLAAPDGSRACRECPTPPDAPDLADRLPVLVRHQVRLQTNLESIDPPRITPLVETFVFVNDGQPFTVRSDGTNGSPDAPSLECASCGELQPVFPRPIDPTLAPPDGRMAASDDGAACMPASALLCSGVDPWSSLDQSWYATYEGAIPGAAGGGALFVAPRSPGNDNTAPAITASIDFCAAGVLGDEDVVAAFEGVSCDAAPAPLGDQLVITSELVESAGPDCAAARKAIEADPDLSLALSFGIRRAYRNRLLITSQLPADAPEALQAIRGYEDVRRCLGGAPMGFYIRTRDSFQVSGSRSGFEHGVIVNQNERCVVDPARATAAQGRALAGCTFDNGSVAFRIRPSQSAAGEREPKTDVRLELRLRSPATGLLLLGGQAATDTTQILTEEIRYLDVDRQLYLVDSNQRGLIALPTGRLNIR